MGNHTPQLLQPYARYNPLPVTLYPGTTNHPWAARDLFSTEQLQWSYIYNHFIKEQYAPVY
jgi:hypothetical protein